MSEQATAVRYADLGLEVGTPDIKSMGAIAFGPDGILFVADNQSASIFALGFGPAGPAPDSQAFAIEDLDARLAAHFDEAIAGRFAEREHPGHVAWTLRAAALAAEASAMLEDTGTYGIHLDARLDLRIRIESNASAFESHRERDQTLAPLSAEPRAPKPASGVEPEPQEPAIDIDPGPGIGF